LKKQILFYWNGTGLQAFFPADVPVIRASSSIRFLLPQQFHSPRRALLTDLKQRDFTGRHRKAACPKEGWRER
jgi:hypothetical protein